MAKITQEAPDGAVECPEQRRSEAELQREVEAAATSLAGYATAQARRAGGPPSFKAFEVELVRRLFALGRLVIALFLEVSDRRVSGGGSRGGGGGIPRWLATRCGWVRYWRRYRRGSDGKRGYHPLDVALGLVADRLSWGILGDAVRLATKLSYAEARTVLSWFCAVAPSTEVIERAVLGLGRHTREWFERACAFVGDGDVLIVLLDSKGAPTATEQELARRRGKRRRGQARQSPRHRGRSKRNKYGSPPRRKKGDKSKHARMATLVVMYTLTRVGRHLLGPVNRWVYASFAPKKHAVAVARREAAKRGFGPGSGKLVQVLTDGDNDLARYVAVAFPYAIHTLDVIHVVERLWTAGEALFKEGTAELRAWAETQKAALYEGRVDAVLAELRRQLALRPKTGPGNKGRRTRLAEIIAYIEKRREKMDYGELRKKDLEIGTGAVEGAVKFIIGKRFDHGGMRWIRERAEALLQLRCIEANGDWDRFLDWVHDKLQAEGQAHAINVGLLTDEPGPLPTLTLLGPGEAEQDDEERCGDAGDDEYEDKEAA